MKRFLLVMLSLVLTLPLAANGEGGKNQKRNRKTNADCGLAQLLAGLPKEELTARETRDLLYMREEEKLARDVYLSLREEWGLRIFANIARAETKHMNATGTLIDKYGLTDPVGDNPLGVFTDSELQQLYGELFAAGKTSLIHALQVGATIEELDIFDLQRALEYADNADLRMLYQNLLKGSTNHLRAFDKQLQRRGVTYQPVYLTQDEYQEILDSAKVRGVVDGDGVLVCGSDQF